MTDVVPSICKDIVLKVFYVHVQQFCISNL
jgi:hypothetical protein